MDALGYLDRFKERRKFQNRQNGKFNFMDFVVACPKVLSAVLGAKNQVPCFFARKDAYTHGGMVNGACHFQIWVHFSELHKVSASF